MARSVAAAGVLATILAVLAAPASIRAADSPAEIVEQIRLPVLEPAAAFSVRDVELDLGPAVLWVERGFMIPARLDGGPRIELVFIGQARFRLEPPDPIEAGQLELFTSEPTFDAAVEEAVLVLAREEAITRLMERRGDRAPRPELLERAAELHRSWLDSTARRTTGIDAALLKSLVGDPIFQEYFAIWCRSFEVGDFLFRLDPEDVEQITLASFQPLELSDWERQRMRHYLRVQRRKQRWLGRRFEDMGAWDIWLSTSWAADAVGRAGQEGFEAKHYELDVTIRRDRMLIDGRLKLELEAQTDGRRTVRLELHHDLLLDRVLDSSERELFTYRSGEEAVVVLAEPVQAGDRITLDVEWSGRGLNWIDGKNFDLTDSGRWYPHAGTVDRATYDVTLRWPKKYEMFAAGTLIETGREGRYRWERRRLDIPSIAYSFVLGSFEVRQAKVGDVEITVAFSGTKSKPPDITVLNEVLESVKSSLTFFESTFGPYPLDELTVVTVPRRFSQSYMGFVTLARSVVGHGGTGAISSGWVRDTTIAHELAHQWWGNLVGWWSYRDQWLSEGMANYAALLYSARGRPSERSLLSLMSSGWHSSLSVVTDEGRTIESLGPIVLGNRLNSSKAANAYRPIVYRKGAVVLAMLARAVGEDRFHEILRSVIRSSSNKVLTTESFMRSVESMSGLDLAAFARQYVYGTGIPQVYYDYDLAPSPAGGWTVRGEARQLSAPRYSYAVVRRDAGGWDLSRVAVATPQDGPTALMVPFQLMIDSDTGEGESGYFFLEGSRHEFEIASASRPRGLSLDPRGEILAGFYSASRHPKRYLSYQAHDLATEGRLDAAESRYRDALRISKDRGPEGTPARRLSPLEDSRSEDARIRVALARLYLDQERDGAAEIELDALDRLLGEDGEGFLRVERDVLRSWLEIRSADYTSARRRLKRTIRIAAPRGDEPLFDVASQLNLSAERQSVIEAYALLAVAAYETERRQDYLWARSEAADRGVDVSALEP